MSGDSKKRIAFNYFGSKFTFCERIVQYFPDHFHYVDLFCGSLVLTLNKPKSKIETANDINGEIINFFGVLRDQTELLIDKLRLTPMSREEFNLSWHMEGCDEIERARRFYVRCRQSFGGMGAQRKNKGWHVAITQSRSNLAYTVSRWNNGVEKLWELVGRLREIQYENRDFEEVIKLFDDERTFFYCDPPYPRDCRGSYGDYKYEFTVEDHERLADLLNKVKGKVMISSYESPTMKRLYKGWEAVSLGHKFNNLRAEGQMDEIIFMNYQPTVGLFKEGQGKIFAD
jgi:DNA adenine methylase